MPGVQLQAFHECFELVSDFRVKGRCAHPLPSILFLVVAAVISNADGPADIESFGKQRKKWLEKFVDFPAGIPSHDTIGRVLALIKPAEFQRALMLWVNRLREENGAPGPIVVPIDGKTVRGSYTKADKSDALHIVSAWATDHGLSLGQVAVDSKSNEITAIPELLKTIELKDKIITIDAMGCQKSIAKKIVDGGGNFTFAVKDNHPSLAKMLESIFIDAHENGLVESGFRSKTVLDKGHGRVEERQYVVGRIPKSMRSIASSWAGLRSIGQVINITTCREKVTTEVRYYISSRAPKVSEFAYCTRGHWGIESMHWILDVVFLEDSSRIRTGHAIENMSFVRRFATTMLKRSKCRSTLRSKRKQAAWNTDFLEKMLFC